MDVCLKYNSGFVNSNHRVFRYTIEPPDPSNVLKLPDTSEDKSIYFK